MPGGRSVFPCTRGKPGKPATLAPHQPALVEATRGTCQTTRQGLRAGMLLAYKEAKIFPDAYHTRLFFINGMPAS